MNQLLD